MGGGGSPEPVKKTPILPGAPSEDDAFNEGSIPNKTDRTKQKEARGQTRDYGGRDKYRHFDDSEDAVPKI